VAMQVDEASHSPWRSTADLSHTDENRHAWP
jgi:hypothetical protein